MIYLPVHVGHPPPVEFGHHGPILGAAVGPLGILNRVPDHVPPVGGAVSVQQEVAIGGQIGERDVGESGEPAQALRESLEVAANKIQIQIAKLNQYRILK